jgi:predicted aldo/keto reductase-like oxidoreductase
VKPSDRVSRRNFLKTAALASAATVAGREAAAAQETQMQEQSQEPTTAIPRRTITMRNGQTLDISILGMGGFHLGSAKSQTIVDNMVAKAIDHGVNFFDNAWDYHDGLSEERVGTALKGKRDKVLVMTKVCTHGRSKEVAMQQLEQSLRRLQTDHLDVWQIHEVVYYNDPDNIFRADGAIEALEQAKKDGKVRFVGFTGHKDPSIHLNMLSRGFPFDTVQMPLNPFDAQFRSFQHRVLPEAKKQSIHVLGMKSMGGSGEMVTHGGMTPEQALRYAMSMPVATTISGMESMLVLDQNLAIAQNFKPMSDAEKHALEQQVKVWAADGRYERFKTTTMYDGAVGRQQHMYPTPEKLPA